MPYWDDPRGPRHDWERERWERDRWRRDPLRDRTGPIGERRVFGDPRSGDPSARDRFGTRRPQDQASFSQRFEDAGSAGYARRRAEADRGGSSFDHGGEPYAYGGQEYGVEGFGARTARGPAWGLDNDADRLRNFDFDDPGVGQSQAGYAAETRSHSDHDFDPDYLRWREEQLRAHDRDYEAWRREQHRQYDEQYQQFRRERQRHFGETFLEWRSQRSAVGGVPDTGAAPGVSGYGGKTAEQGGGGDRTPEFGKEPGAVQAASDGDVRPDDDKAEERAKDGDVRRR